MAFADLIAALLLPLPPWLGFWIFRRKGRIGLSYGYFLGGILTMLALPWARLAGSPVPTSQLGGALFGFTLFLQAQREGVQGVRRLALGVGGATGFLLLLLLRLHLPWQDVARFWVGAALEGLLWLLFSDLAYRWTKGSQLEIRMPVVGAAALGLGALAQYLLPVTVPRLSWPAALLAGILLGLVALQQLRWLRNQGAWVEGRGEGLRLALALLEQKAVETAPTLVLGLSARQPMWLVDAQGRILESNGPFSQLAGLPRHRLRGFSLDAIFQGGESPVWEDLRSQLLQYGWATVQATQVSEDGTFRQVGLEACTFDRGMALIWMKETAAGSLALVGGGPLDQGGTDDDRRRRANAVLALSAAVGWFRNEVVDGPLLVAANQVRAAATRLDPSLAQAVMPPPLEGRVALAQVMPGLTTILPAGGSLRLQAAELSLATDFESLKRIATHLVLHALERSKEGQLALILEPVDLGSRVFGLLHVRPEGGRIRPIQTIFGLAWLRQAVQTAGGVLELDQDLEGGLRPRVYLPTTCPTGMPDLEHALEGQHIWVVDQDPLAREALMSLVQQSGGQALAYEDLRGLLRESRGRRQPDVLVLERTPRLERFHRSLRAFQKDPIPTVVMGMGHPLPINPSALGFRRLGFIDKPFHATTFLESLLALLHQPDGTDGGLL